MALFIFTTILSNLFYGILENLRHQNLFWNYLTFTKKRQKSGRFFFIFCGVLRISELYECRFLKPQFLFFSMYGNFCFSWSWYCHYLMINTLPIFRERTHQKMENKVSGTVRWRRSKQKRVHTQSCIQSYSQSVKKRAF